MAKEEINLHFDFFLITVSSERRVDRISSSSDLGRHASGTSPWGVLPLSGGGAGGVITADVGPATLSWLSSSSLSEELT